MTDRNLYAPLRTDDELDAHFPPPRYKAVKQMDYRPAWYETHPACTADACQSGDKPCPCPDACRLTDDNRDSSEQALAAWLIGAGITGAVVLILAALFWRP